MVKRIKSLNRVNWLFTLSLLVIITSCDTEEFNPDSLVLNFDFQQDPQGWIGGFSDYHDQDNAIEFYEMEFSHQNLPSPLNQSLGSLRIHGSNRSDDLFMYIKKQISGLVPNRHYRLNFDIEFATDVASGLVGIGGAPGESVYVKAGGTMERPALVLDTSENLLRLDIDKGNQSQGGSQMQVIGHIANGTEESTYMLKRIQSQTDISVQADAEGQLWVIIGTDSGFEGITTLYYNSVSIELQSFNN